jgi:hypothetical protein
MKDISSSSSLEGVGIGVAFIFCLFGWSISVQSLKDYRIDTEVDSDYDTDPDKG